jgi:hypothetical protein
MTDAGETRLPPQADGLPIDLCRQITRWVDNVVLSAIANPASSRFLFHASEAERERYARLATALETPERRAAARRVLVEGYALMLREGLRFFDEPNPVPGMSGRLLLVDDDGELVSEHLSERFWEQWRRLAPERESDDGSIG